MPVITVHVAGRQVLHADLDDGATLGRSPSCRIVLPHPTVAELHATVRYPDGGDDGALYLGPGASARVGGELARGRAVLWGPVCLFEIGPFLVRIDDLPVEVPTDYTIKLGPAAPGAATYQPHDATERELLASLRAQPSDDDVREVYADWLEEHAFPLRARLLRAETAAARPGCELELRLPPMAPLDDHPWRAVTARAPIDRCVEFRTSCPKRWSALAVTADDRVRQCATCNRAVHYCTSVDDARAHGAQGHCIAIDAAVARGEALAAYDDDGDILTGEIA